MARRQLLLSAVLGTALCLNATVGAAQAGPQPGVFVFSQNKCAFATLPQLTAVVDSMFAPILNELVAQGRLLGWGQLEHSWGDEWNWNIYYTASDTRAFFDAFGEFVQRMNQRYPSWPQRFANLCTEHKDNIYAVHSMRGRP